MLQATQISGNDYLVEDVVNGEVVKRMKVAVAAGGVYGLVQTFGSGDTPVAASKPAVGKAVGQAQGGLRTKAKQGDEDSVKPVKSYMRGPSTSGLGF